MGLKGVIFDLDGVIVDTVPLHFKGWKKMFAEYGKDFSFKDYKEKVDGIPRLDGAKAILGDLSAEELKVAAAKKQAYFLEFLDKEGVKVYASTINLIKDLRVHSLKVAVISSSKNCLRILKKANIDNLFDVIITGNDVARGKPYPDVFFLAAQKLALKPEQCVVFEDALLGVEATKRARMACVGIDRYQDPQRLNKADLVISNVSQINVNELKELLKR